MSGLRVCHLGKYYPPARGGIETHVEALARGQAAAGMQARVVCVNHEVAGRDATWSALARTRTRAERLDGVEVRRVGRVANLARFDVCPRLWAEVRQALRGSDVVHLHVPNPTMMTALAAAPSRTAVVITLHSDVVRQRRLRYLLRPLEVALAARARRIFATSPRYASGSWLLQRFAEKVRVLPLGVDLSRFAAPSAEALAAAEELERTPGPRWLMVGRLVYYKGLDVALQALREVPGTLWVVGTGPLRPELERSADRLGVSNRVRWLGEVEDDWLVGALRAATALWFPSHHRSEAFGLVQVEAMASGCPVLNAAIEHSGVPWVSPDGVSGLTVPPHDAAALAAAARRLLDEPDLAARLGEGGRARAAAEFSAETMVDRCAALYAEALTC